MPALLPVTLNAPVVRTDFSDDSTWLALTRELRAPVEEFGMEFYANLDFVDDPAFAELASDQITSRVPDNLPHSFLILADATTAAHPDRPLLIVDLNTQPGRTFRALPNQIQGVENNLTISNMDFEEFADSVDSGDGIFRGFPRG